MAPSPGLGWRGVGRITRWLRFRLTFSYVIFFALLLASVGLLFRGVLNSILNDQVSAILEEEWGAVKGYMRIEKQKPLWSFDRDDPEESFFVERLRKICLIADAGGTILEVSEEYKQLGPEKPTQIRSAMAANLSGTAIRRSGDGTPYMVRYGIVIDEKKPFYIAIGKSLADNDAVLARFTTYYFSFLPAMILGCSLLGWFVSKRALIPLTELAQSTDAISGANLSMRLRQRGAGDELDHLISTFNRMVERLEESFKQSRQFSTDVSHELRTPLTVVRGQLEVALMTATNVEQYREAIMKSLEDVERLSNTVRALLHLAQAESGQLRLHPVELDLAALIDTIADHFLILADAKAIRLTTRGPAPCLIEADRVMIERLVSNLVSNAIKYTAQNGEITLAWTAHSDDLLLDVIDTGTGIPPEALPHIFDRFYRVPGQDPEKGLGLGLSFAAWIVKAHNGTIEVQSKVGEGTRFRVHLNRHFGPAIDSFGSPNASFGATGHSTNLSGSSHSASGNKEKYAI